MPRHKALLLEANELFNLCNPHSILGMDYENTKENKDSHDRNHRNIVENKNTSQDSHNANDIQIKDLEEIIRKYEEKDEE